MRKIGLALSGGGLRGTAHIGILKVLAAEGIHFDFVAGNSAGSIVAGMYALGITPAEMEAIVRGIEYNQIFEVNLLNLLRHTLRGALLNAVGTLLPPGFFPGDRLEKFLNTVYQGKTYRDTCIPVATLTVDINSGETVIFHTPVNLRDTYVLRNTVYITEAPLAVGVRASTAVPGVFLPKQYQGRALVDGVIKNNVPTDILHCMGAQRILAVDLGYAGERMKEINNLFDIMIQSAEIMGREITLYKSEKYANLIIRPRIYDVGLTELSRIPEIIARGEEAARQHLPMIRDALGIR